MPCCHNTRRVPSSAIGVIATLLYSDRLLRMQQDDKMDGELVTTDGDGHAKDVSGNEYLVLLFIVTTL
jgi:hypothetical protein